MFPDRLLAGSARLPEPYRIDRHSCGCVVAIDYETVLILVGKLPSGSDDFVD
jgi:hypothetical protein